MPDFSDMRSLESEANALERLLAQKRTLIQNTLKALQEGKANIEKIDRHIAFYQERIHRMRHEYPVVLLAEYEKALEGLSLNEGFREDQLEMIETYNTTIKSAQEATKALADDLRRVERNMAGFCKVIPFRR